MAGKFYVGATYTILEPVWGVPSGIDITNKIIDNDQFSVVIEAGKDQASLQEDGVFSLAASGSKLVLTSKVDNLNIKISLDIAMQYETAYEITTPSTWYETMGEDITISEVVQKNDKITFYCHYWAGGGVADRVFIQTIVTPAGTVVENKAQVVDKFYISAPRTSLPAGDFGQFEELNFDNNEYFTSSSNNKLSGRSQIPISLSIQKPGLYRFKLKNVVFQTQGSSSGGGEFVSSVIASSRQHSLVSDGGILSCTFYDANGNSKVLKLLQNEYDNAGGYFDDAGSTIGNPPSWGINPSGSLGSENAGMYFFGADSNKYRLGSDSGWYAETVGMENGWYTSSLVITNVYTEAYTTEATYGAYVYKSTDGYSTELYIGQYDSTPLLNIVGEYECLTKEDISFYIDEISGTIIDGTFEVEVDTKQVAHSASLYIGDMNNKARLLIDKPYYNIIGSLTNVSQGGVWEYSAGVASETVWFYDKNGNSAGSYEASDYYDWDYNEYRAGDNGFQPTANLWFSIDGQRYITTSSTRCSNSYSYDGSTDQCSLAIIVSNVYPITLK